MRRFPHAEKIRTPITDMFGIKHPVLLAGMNVAAGPRLAAAVSNAGGLGVIGGVGYTPDMLKEQIAELKEYLDDKNAPFGVDLLLPQVGGNARKTKYVTIHQRMATYTTLPQHRCGERGGEGGGEKERRDVLTGD